MRKSTILVTATMVVFPLASPLAEACGDKLLSIARGIRLQQAYKARHPASILLYIGEAAALKTSRERGALVQMSILYMSLRQAGHGLEVAQNSDELGQALKSRNFDFVMADLRDLPEVAEQVTLRPSVTDVLPVLFKPSKADFAAAQKQFKLVLKTPARSTDHLEAIDRVMKSRSAGASPGF